MKVFIESIEKSVAKTGNEFLKVLCVSTDKTKRLLYLWDNVSGFMELYNSGEKVYDCQISADANFPKIVSFTVSSGQPNDFYEFMYADDAYAKNVYLSLKSSIKDDFLSSLIDEVMAGEFNGKTVNDAFILIPAAKAYHHNYRYGLLRHTHEVMSFVSRISEADLFKDSIDREVVLAAALMHDVGKVYEYSFDGINTADYGKGLEINQIYLGSHLYKGAEMVAVAYEKLIHKKPEFNTEQNKIKTEHVKHIILCHHLQQEWGAIPKSPKTIEGYLVFLADYFSAAFGKYSVLDFNDVTTNDFMRETSKYDNFFGFNSLIKKLEE